MRTRTARSGPELRPENRSVPPGGLEPPPAIFAQSCPVHGTVAGVPTGGRARGGPPGRSQRMESNHLARGMAAAAPCPGCVRIRRGTGWVRTSAHPFNKRPLNLLSFGPKYRCVATPAAVAVRRAFAAATRSEAPRASEVGHDRMRRVEIDRVAHSGVVRIRDADLVRRHPGHDQPGRDFPCCSPRPHVLERVHVARPVSWSRIDTWMSTATRSCCARRSAERSWYPYSRRILEEFSIERAVGIEPGWPGLEDQCVDHDTSTRNGQRSTLDASSRRWESNPSRPVWRTSPSP